MNELSQNIAILRKQCKMSQSDLANILFVTPQAISRWERGETEPDVETIKKLAEVFKVSVEEIIYGPTSKWSKRMQKILHRSYLIGSIGIVILSIVSIILTLLGFTYTTILIAFGSISVVYLIYLLVCEMIQQRLKKIPVRKEQINEQPKTKTK